MSLWSRIRSWFITDHAALDKALDEAIQKIARGESATLPPGWTVQLESPCESPTCPRHEGEAGNEQGRASEAIEPGVATGLAESSDGINEPLLVGMAHPFTQADAHKAESEKDRVFPGHVVQVEGSASASRDQSDHKSGVIPVLDVEASQVHFSPPGCSSSDLSNRKTTAGKGGLKRDARPKSLRSGNGPGVTAVALGARPVGDVDCMAQAVTEQVSLQRPRL